MLACSASKLKHLTIQLHQFDFRDLDDSFGKLFGCTHARSSLRGLSGFGNQWEQLPTQFPPLGLSSLVLVISSSHTSMNNQLALPIHFATKILAHVNKDYLMDVRVEFKADPLAILGTHISGAGASLEACKQLDEALLTFPKSAVLVHDPVHNRRTGRAKFWSPIIRRAFPRMDERGLLILKFTPCEWKLVSRCRNETLIPLMLSRKTMLQIQLDTKTR